MRNGLCYALLCTEGEKQKKQIIIATPPSSFSMNELRKSVPATSAVLLFQMSELMLTCAFRGNGSAREGASSLRRLTSSSLASSSSSSSSITTATTLAQRSKIYYSFLQNNFSSYVQSRNLSALKNRYTRNEGRAIGTIGSERYFSHSNTNMRRRARFPLVRARVWETTVWLEHTFNKQGRQEQQQKQGRTFAGRTTSEQRHHLKICKISE